MPIIIIAMEYSVPSLDVMITCFWAPAFLIGNRYSEDGAPLEVMLIDLQICRRESFAVDLNYLLYTSLTGDVRKPNLKTFLETYRSQFNAVMEAGGGDALLSETEMLEEFRSKNALGAIFSMMIIGALLMEPEDVPDFSSDGSGENDVEKAMAELRKKNLEMIDTNPLMRPRFLSVFDELLEAGIIPSWRAFSHGMTAEALCKEIRPSQVILDFGCNFSRSIISSTWIYKRVRKYLFSSLTFCDFFFLSKRSCFSHLFTLVFLLLYC